MGNSQSAIGELVAQLEKALPSEDTRALCRRFVELSPYWEVEGRSRALHDLSSGKLLEVVLGQLGHELSQVNLSAREYSYDGPSVGMLLHCLDQLLVSKALYKTLSKQNLKAVTLSLRVSLRRGDDDVALQAANAVRVITERVGFREFKAGKEANQVSREADAKEKLIADGLVEALLDSLAFLHARSNPLVADAIIRIAISLLCSRQDTTPFLAATTLHAAIVSQHLPLLFELSRHAYPRLHVSACGLLKGLFLEGDAAVAAKIQSTALEWGALVWHLRWSITPSGSDDAFSLPTPLERQLCERLWAECDIPLGSGKPGLGSCCAQGPLVDMNIGDVTASTSGWSPGAPAARGAHVSHRLAREASRELVAVLCFRNAAAQAAVARLLPPGLVQAHFSAGSSASKSSTLQPSESTAVLFDAAACSPQVADAPVMACDDSMFMSPRARIVYSAAAAAIPSGSPGKGLKKQQQNQSSISGVSLAWLSTTLWSGDSDIPVALGRSGCLWWDAALSSPAQTRAQRQALFLRVKVAWFGVVPESKAVHTGPSIATTFASTLAAPDNASDAAAPGDAIVAALSPAPVPVSTSRYEPTILVVQTSSGAPQWRGLWRALTHGPVYSPTVVWTRESLMELRDWLWAEEGALDRRRRQIKRIAQSRGDAGKETGVASAIAGARVSSALSSQPTSQLPKRQSGPKNNGAIEPVVDVGRAWFGYEDAVDQSHMVPDVRVVVDGLSTMSSPCIAWDASTCQMSYSSLDSLLSVEDVFIAHLLPALIALGQPAGSSDVGIALPPHLPNSFPTSVLASLNVETNPRRRLALLQTLRVLAAVALDDPLPSDFAKMDPLAIPLISGASTAVSFRPIDPAAFDEATGIIEWCVHTLAMCSVGLADTGGESFGIIAGPDGAVSSSPVAYPVVASVFGHVVRAHASKRDTGVSSTSALWPSASEAVGLVGGGDQPYWLALLRQECLILLRLLVNRRSLAMRFGNTDRGIVALLQLMQLPPGTAEEAPAPRALASSLRTVQEDSPNVELAVEMPVAVDTSGMIDVVNAYVRIRSNQNATPVPSSVLAVPVSCLDVGLPSDVSGVIGKAGPVSLVAFPYPSSFSCPASMLQSRDEAVIFDPDAMLILNHHLLPRAALGRAAAEALQAAIRTWPCIAKRFAREDIMQALILSLMHAPQHPRIIGVTLQLLRLVLPQIPMYNHVLDRHAFPQALLLTSLSSSLGADQGGTDGYASLGFDVGLCADAAALLHEYHLCAYDELSCGWLELSNAPPRSAARFLVDATDVDLPLPQAASACNGGFTRSNATTFQWSSQDAKSASRAAIASSSLAPFLPPSLIRILQESGPEEFARVFNSKSYVSPLCLWSSKMRARLLDAILSQVDRLRAWIRNGASAVSSCGLHPCAAVESHDRVRSAACGIKSIAQMRGFLQPYPTVANCSASTLLCVPPVFHTPLPTKVTYPDLDSEPRVGGVYLRVYVEGQSLPPSDATSFLQSLVSSLHREIAAVLAARLAIARLLACGSIESTGIDALESYRCSHMRTLLTLRALRRFLAESPGAKLEADAYSALAMLFASVLGRYPRVSCDGILPPPANMGSDDSHGIRLSSLATTIASEALPPLPLSLELLLPLDCVASCDPQAEARPDLRAAGSSVSTMNPFAVGASVPKDASLNAATISSNPFDAKTSRPTNSETSTQVLACVNSPAHALALRGILVGQVGDSADVVLPAFSASAGVHTGTSSVSLISMALDVLLQSIKPGMQAMASRKAVQGAVDGGLWEQLFSFVAWAVPLHAARASELLAVLAARTHASNDDITSVPSVGSDCGALSHNQRIRLYVAAPLSVATLRLIALAAATDPGTQLLINQPQLLLPLVRAARVPWPGPTLEPQVQGAPLPWIPTARMCFSAGVRIAEPAISALCALAPVFALRQTLLDLGVPLLLLQGACGGPAWMSSSHDNTSSTEAPDFALGPKLSPLSLMSVLSRRPERLRVVGECATSTQRVEDTDETSSFDLEDVGTSVPPEASHAFWLWPLRLAAEDCLRILCDKSGNAPVQSDAVPAQITARRSERPSVFDASFALIAEEAAAELEGDDTDSAPQSPLTERKVRPSLSRRKSIGIAKAALFRSVGTTGDAPQTRMTSGVGSFAVSAAAKSVRGAPPLVNHLQATTSIANFVRNLITPGVYRILCPSALESLALGSGSATAPSRSVLRILRGATPTEQAHLIWTPAMRERLLSRLSIEMVTVDQRLISSNAFLRLTGTDPSRSFGLAADSVRPSTSNPFDDGSSAQVSRNPFASEPQSARNVVGAVGSARGLTPTQAPVLWSHEAFNEPELWRRLYPSLGEELVVLGVYVRVYMRAPPAELDTMRPTPNELIQQILYEMDGLNAKTPTVKQLSPDAVTTLKTLAVAAAELVVVKPTVIPRAAGYLHCRALLALIARDLQMQKYVESREDTPFTVVAAGNPFGAPPSTTPSVLMRESWNECLRALLFLSTVLSTYTPFAEALSVHLHALHVIIRREERARRDHSSTAAESTSRVSKTITEDEPALLSLLSELRGASAGLLALGSMTQVLFHSRDARAVVVRSGVLASLLAIATSALLPQPESRRLLAWQAIAAVCGAVQPALTRPNDTVSWRPNPQNACLLLASQPDFVASEQSGTELDALVEGSPAAYFCNVAWPVFDAASGRGLPTLAAAWENPKGAAARWELTLQQPLVVWTVDTRADATAFLKEEWALVDEWLAAHPSEPCTLRGSTIARPHLDRALCVGGVFVRPFNAAPHARDVDMPAFSAALAAHLSMSAAALSSSPVGGIPAADALDVLRALQSTIDACSDSRNAVAIAEIMPRVCDATLLCLHAASLPPALVLSAGAWLPTLIRAPGALAALARQPSIVIVRLLHCLSAASAAVESGEESLKAAVGVFSFMCEASRRNESLTRAMLGSPLVPHCVRAILRGGRAGATPSLRALGLAAAGAASELVMSDVHGPNALALLCDLFDPGWAAAGAWGQRAEGILAFAAASRDASSASGERRWDDSARLALDSFLENELQAVDAVLRVAGSTGLDTSLARWDPGRIRVLHPQPLDTALLALPKPRTSVE